MFPLDTAIVPTTSQAWHDALVAAIRLWIEVPPIVQLDGEVPHFDRLTVDLSGGTLVSVEGPNVSIVDQPVPGPTIAQIGVAARHLSIRGIPVVLDLAATSVETAVGHNAAGKAAVTITSAADGQTSVAIAARDLDSALLQLARAGSAPHGVEILAVKFQFTPHGPRDLDVALDLTAKKFVKFTVRVTGRLSVDDTLTATATNLKVDGSGMAAGFAAGILRSQLAKLEGQGLRLMAFNLGDVRLRDVSVDVTDGLALRAAFGAPPKTA
jgi:hypothetical protein